MSDCHFVPLGSYDFSYQCEFPLPWNPTVYCLIAAISAVPMYVTIELTFQLYAKFKKYNGLYFWSILITTWALTIRQVGRVFVYFVPGCSKVFTLLFAMVRRRPVFAPSPYHTQPMESSPGARHDHYRCHHLTGPDDDRPDQTQRLALVVSDNGEDTDHGLCGPRDDHLQHLHLRGTAHCQRQP